MLEVVDGCIISWGGLKFPSADPESTLFTLSNNGEKYCPALSDSWEAIASPPTVFAARRSVASAVVQTESGKALFLWGGTDLDGVAHYADGMLYFPATNSWIHIPEEGGGPDQRRKSRVKQLGPDAVVMWGGFRPGPAGFMQLQDAWLFSLSTRRWTSIDLQTATTPIFTEGCDVDEKDSMFICHNNSPIILGGWKLLTQSWETLYSSNTQPDFASISIVPGGKILWNSVASNTVSIAETYISRMPANTVGGFDSLGYTGPSNFVPPDASNNAEGSTAVKSKWGTLTYSAHLNQSTGRQLDWFDGERWRMLPRIPSYPTSESPMIQDRSLTVCGGDEKSFNSAPVIVLATGGQISSNGPRAVYNEDKTAMGTYMIFRSR